MAALEPFVDKTWREIASAWQDIAAAMGWDRCENRLRLDNLGEKDADRNENI